MHQEKFSGQDPLWQSFLDGSRDAYARIYEIYARPMYLYGLHFCGDAQVVEDAIHDIFVKLYTNRRKLPELRNVRLYLLISLKNTLFNHAGSKSFRFRMDISVCDLLPDQANAENDMVEKEDLARCRQLVAELEKNLSPRQKQAVYYRFVEQLHYNEIGTMMEINPQSAKNLVHSSIKKIREIYPHMSSIALMAAVIMTIW